MSNDAYSDDELPYNSRSLQHGFNNSIHATSFDKKRTKGRARRRRAAASDLAGDARITIA